MIRLRQHMWKVEEMTDVSVKDFVALIGGGRPELTSMHACFALDRGLLDSDFASFDVNAWDEAANALLKENGGSCEPHVALVAKFLRPDAEQAKPPGKTTRRSGGTNTGGPVLKNTKECVLVSISKSDGEDKAKKVNANYILLSSIHVCCKCLGGRGWEWGREGNVNTSGNLQLQYFWQSSSDAL